MWTPHCYFSLSDTSGAQVLLLAGNTEAKVRVSYLGNPTGSVTTVAANTCAAVAINMNDPAFGPAPHCGAVELLTVDGSGSFCAFLAFNDSPALNPVSGSQMPGFSFRVPLLPGSSRAKLNITNTSAMTASVRITQPAGGYDSGILNVNSLTTYQWDSATHLTPPLQGELLVVSNTTIVLSASLFKGIVYHVNVPTAVVAP